MGVSEQVHCSAVQPAGERNCEYPIEILQLHRKHPQTTVTSADFILKLQEACYPYWPMVLGESVTFGKLTVTLQSESINTDHVVRKLVVSEKKAMPVDVREPDSIVALVPAALSLFRTILSR